MSASALSSHEQSSVAPIDGPRPVRPRQDLGAIADLIELAFGATMDAGGQSAVSEMRALSRTGPLLWLLAHLDKGVRSMNRGFVWIDPDSSKLVGNVSIYDAEYDNLWVIANVATHPDFRRRGIAYELMLMAFDLAVQRGKAGLILQVEADNHGAQHLYERLGFRVLRGFIRWQWRPYLDPPVPLRDMPSITLRRGRDWKADLALAETVRPDRWGGLGWLQPTKPASFRKSLRGHLFGMFNPRQRQRWIVRGDDGELLASLPIESMFGASNSRGMMMVIPEMQGVLEQPLLNFALRHVADQRRGLVIEHPDDDEAAIAVFRMYQFEAKRHLIHMQWTPGA